MIDTIISIRAIPCHSPNFPESWAEVPGRMGELAEPHKQAVTDGLFGAKETEHIPISGRWPNNRTVVLVGEVP